MKPLIKAGICAITVLSLHACSMSKGLSVPFVDSVPSISGGLPGDGAGRQLDPNTLADAVPRHEPRSRGGNKSPYKVNGRLYYVLDDAKDYTARGVASWYGTKFHGNLTANGERYDMYKMTAAHRSLPLPSYVRVTNLDSNRSVIVRVNDRGPFVDDRLIDLSYAAGVKLGMLKSGTAKVSVEVINTSRGQAYGETTIRTARTSLRKTEPSAVRTASGATSNNRYIEVGEFDTMSEAKRSYERMRFNLSGVRLHRGAHGQYNVRVGPMYSPEMETAIMGRIRSLKIANPQPVNIPASALDCLLGC